MVGVLRVDWPAFQCAVPSRVLADDDERMALMRAMKICASVMANTDAALFHDPTGDEGDEE